MAFKDWFRRGDKKGVTFVRNEMSYAEISALSAGGEPITPAGQNANSIIASALRWAMLNAVEPPIQLLNTAGKPVAAGPVFDLVTNPVGKLDREFRPHQTEHSIRQGLLACLMLDGNAFLWKHRNGGRLGAYQFLPLYSVSVEADPRVPGRIRGYRVNNNANLIPPEDICHIRLGVDPAQPFLGISPLKSCLRQVMADNMIAAYTSAILQKPTPGGVITPPQMAASQVQPETFTPDQCEMLRKSIDAQAGGKRAGSFLIFPRAVQFQKMDFSPKDLDIQIMAKIGEERITSAIGIPAMVLGIGAGLDRSTYANYEEARKAATEDFLVPMWELIETAITEQIVSEVGTGLSLHYDTSKVRALAENTDKLAQRAQRLFLSNLIDRARALEMIGEEFGPPDIGVYAWMLRPAGLGGGPVDMSKGRKAREAAEGV
jgi:HK97 family phage portal protein